MYEGVGETGARGERREDGGSRGRKLADRGSGVSDSECEQARGASQPTDLVLDLLEGRLAAIQLGMRGSVNRSNLHQVPNKSARPSLSPCFHLFDPPLPPPCRSNLQLTCASTSPASRFFSAALISNPRFLSTNCPCCSSKLFLRALPAKRLRSVFSSNRAISSRTFWIRRSRSCCASAVWME